MFPYIEVAGTHRQIGQAIGERLRKEIKRSLDLYFDRLQKSKKVFPAKAKAMLSKTVERYFPRFVEELHGMAEGAAVVFDDLLTFSFEEELSPGEKCTTLAVKSGQTIFFAHNEDWDSVLPMYVVKAKPKNQPAYVSVANTGHFPGTVAGLNEHGLAFAGNSINTKINFAGLPKTYCLRSFLECRTVADARGVVARAPRSIGNNSVLVSHKEKRIVSLEWSPQTFHIIEAEHGFGHTNHFVSHLRKHQSEKTSYSSERRLAHIEEALLKLAEPTLADLKKLMRTHINSRASICRHTGWKTLTSVIVDTAARKMYVAPGNPCTNSYRTFSL